MSLPLFVDAGMVPTNFNHAIVLIYLCENYNLTYFNITAAPTVATTTASIQLCSTNVCANSGVCYVVSGALRCVCPSGFTGTYCEISSRIYYILNINQVLKLYLTAVITTTTTTTLNGCLPNPCQNSGTCVTQANGAFAGCFCTSAFIGTFCQST